MKNGSLVAVGALMAATCSMAGCSSSPVPVGGADSTAASSADPPQQTVLSARDKELAKQSLIRLSDFPAGWTAQGKVTEGDGSTGLSKAQAERLTRCLKVPASDIDTGVPHWTSPTFSDSSDAATVNDDVTVYPSATEAATDYSTFSDPRTPKCLVGLIAGPLKQQIGRQLEQGQRIGQVRAGSRPFPSYGDHSGDIEVVVPIIEGAKEAPVYIDIIVVLSGRTESTLTESSPGIPVQSSLSGKLAQAAAARIRAVN